VGLLDPKFFDPALFQKFNLERHFNAANRAELERLLLQDHHAQKERELAWGIAGKPGPVTNGTNFQQQVMGEPPFTRQRDDTVDALALTMDRLKSDYERAIGVPRMNEEMIRTRPNAGWLMAHDIVKQEDKGAMRMKPSEERSMREQYEPIVKMASNTGWIVTVGCRTFVFTQLAKLNEFIKDFYSMDEEEFRKKYVKNH